MTTRNAGQIAAIGQAAELTLLVPRDATHRLVPVWAVVAGGAVWVRAYQGPGSWWYRTVRTRPGGGIRLGGEDIDARFSPPPDADEAAIDAAYRQKYGWSTAVAAVLTDQARAATLRVDPVEVRS